ncbi:MAG: AAA family ATPase [Acidobacteriota bacterium]|nr:AAA family ATPase [Acidobacteriota bacterium]
MSQSAETGTSTGALRAAVISSNPGFAKGLQESLDETGHAISLVYSVTAPYTEIDDSHLDKLREGKPEITFLDLEDEPHVGLKFAQFVVDSGFTGALIALGSTDSPQLILQAMQAGVTEFVGKPIDSNQLSDALERVLRKTGRQARRRTSTPGHLLMVFSAKGGTGSTAVAANLATELHRLSRKRTLLVDLDLELGESALVMGVEPKFSVVDLVRNFHRVDSRLLASYIERHETGVEILSAPYQPADYEAVSADRVRQVLQFLKQHFDYIVVDAPKTFTPATMGAFEEADRVYLVTTADIPSLRNLTRSINLVRSFGRKKADDWIRLLVNRFDPNQVVTTAEIEKTLGIEVFWTLRNDYKAVMSSINTGRPAVSDPKSAFAKDIRALASKLTDTQIETSGKGWLGGILGRNGRRDSD